MKFRKILFTSFFISALAIVAPAQSFEKIADDTFMFLKSGTFAKPSVSKNTGKLALAQVRVHYKVITTEMAARKGTSARVTAYLETDVYEKDLQQLTDEFYRHLQQKLAPLGIEFVGWDQIQATEYYKERQAVTEDNKRLGSDVKNGQGWYSFSAQGGPVFIRYNPGDATSELIGYGKFKKIQKFIDEVGADLMTLDVVVDFAGIEIGVSSGSSSKYILGGQKISSFRRADWSVTPVMMASMGNITLAGDKNKFEGFAVKAPIVSANYFAKQPYEDPNRASLTTQRFFGTTFTATPVVIEAERALYLNNAREILRNYTDLLVEKLRLIRGGEKRKDENAVAQNKPVDDTNIREVKEDARRNNETTPVTTSELTAAVRQAVSERKIQLAVDYLGELIRLNPDDYRYHVERGALYLNELKNAKEALKDFNRAIELNPNDAVNYFNRGLAYSKSSDWKKAKADFDKFISLRPDYAPAYLERGIVLVQLKKDSEALADFNTGLRLDPRLPNLYRARAFVYKLQGKGELAQADELRAAQIERGQ